MYNSFGNVFSGKKVFITGHTGFKGSWLTEWLLSLNAEVAGYSLYLPSVPCHFSELNLKNRITHFEGDIRNLPLLSEALNSFQPDVLFHLAAQPIVSTSISSPLETFETNVMGTLNVLENLIKIVSIKAAVIITSDKCYENMEWEFGYREIDRLGGKDPYSASKACAEIGIKSYFRTYLSELENRIHLASARAGNVLGGGDWAKDRLIPDCMKNQGMGLTPVVRSPSATRPWQHVLEPLSGYLRLAQIMLERNKNINGESFNFGPDGETNANVINVLQEIKKNWKDFNWEIQQTNLSTKEAGLLKLSCDKALHLLQWTPTLNFKETIQMTVDWYKDYYTDNGFSAHQRTLSQIEYYQKIAYERNKVWMHC